MQNNQDLAADLGPNGINIALLGSYFLQCLRLELSSLAGHPTSYVWMSITTYDESYLSGYTLDAFSGNYFDMNEGYMHVMKNLKLMVKPILTVQ